MFGNTSAGSAVQPCIRPRLSPHWLEIELFDQEGFPVPGEEYVVTLPDGQEVSGYLDEEGFERLELDTPGDCKVTFPKLDSRAWRLQTSTHAK